MTVAVDALDTPGWGGSVRARLLSLVPPPRQEAADGGAPRDGGWGVPGLAPEGREPGWTSPQVAAALAEAAEAFATLRGVQERCYRALDALVTSGAADETGYRSVHRLVGEHLHLDESEAKRLLREAGALLPRPLLDGHEAAASLPTTAEMLAEGRLGVAHVSVIERTNRAVGRMAHVDRATREEVERQLAALAADRTPAALAAAAAEVLALLDPDGAAPSDHDIPTDELHLTSRRDGSLAGTFHYRDPVAAAALRTALDAATPPPSADGDPAAGTPGSDPLRTLAERRAQGLLDLAAEALTRGGPDEADDLTADAAAPAATPDAPDDAPEHATDDAHGDSAGGTTGATGTRPWTRPDTEGGDRVHLAVTIDWELLRGRLTGDSGGGDPPDGPRYEPGHLPGLGHLDPGIPIGPETARRLACDAELLPAVLGARGEPLDIGRRTRVVPAGLRRALVLRDRHCAHPGCRRRARRCHAHHVRHWAQGGPTSLDNLVLLCSFHHAVAHHGGWTITFHEGMPWFTPPRWFDPDRRPRHNRPGTDREPERPEVDQARGSA